MSANVHSEFFIEVSGLQKRFGEQQVLRGVDLKIRRGETMVILGQSGEGKSVILKHLIGLHKIQVQHTNLYNHPMKVK